MGPLRANSSFEGCDTIMGLSDTTGRLRHAELAWRIAAWACEVGGPTVRAQIVSAFAVALEGRSAGLAMELPCAGVTEGLGQLAPAKERAIRDRILKEVVAPCARALLAA